MPVIMTLRGYTLIFIDEETEAPRTQIIYQNTSQELHAYFFNERKKDGAGNKGSGIQGQAFLIPKPKISPVDDPLPILIPIGILLSILRHDEGFTKSLN